jgi:phospholipid/cholesterol/gamma-HCH transport system permease protein
MDKTAKFLDRIFLNFLESAKEALREVGDIAIFGWTSLRLSFSKPSRYSEIIKHMEFVGNQSVFIVALTALFTGLAISFQLYLGFKVFNAVLPGPCDGHGFWWRGLP